MFKTNVLMSVRQRSRAGRAGLALSIGLCGPGCQGQVNTPAPSSGATVSFAADVLPIFAALCVSCHVTGGFADQQGIPLKLTPTEAFAMLVNQSSVQNQALTLVAPGDSAGSLLFQKVSSDTPPVGVTMPLVGRRLTAEELAVIRDWIDQGAMNN